MHVSNRLDLAIIIPAFRVQHLEETLTGLVNQTDQAFRVYIGDDASPEPIEGIVSSFYDRLNIYYHRFETNLGGSSLVQHWHRCISLSKSERWLWLFSDDDVAEPECVGRFYDALNSTQTIVDLYRFQMDFIDLRSRRISRPRDHPDYENASDLLKALLTDRHRAWRAQDHIFSREIYEVCGGFVDFPKGIYSDHATWLRFSEKSGVRTIRGPRVLWRSHPHGTSSGRREANRHQWLIAACRYVEWLKLFAQKQGNATAKVFQTKGLDFYFRELAHFRPVITVPERDLAIDLAQVCFGGARLGLYLYLYFVLIRYKLFYWRIAKPFLGWLKRCSAKWKPTLPAR